MKKLLIIPLSIGLLMGCSSPKEETEVAQTTIEVHRAENEPVETLNVGILAINGVYNSELMAPYDIFQHTLFHTYIPMKVFIVSPSEDIIETFEGIKITPDYDFDSVPEIDVLVVPSAEHNMDTDLEDDRLITFVKEKGAEARFVMSLCDGAFILAQAGLLDGLRCTTFPNDIERFKEAFPHLDVRRDISFVHDGKAITSAGGAKSYEPALYLVEYLYGKKPAEGVGKGLVIDWKLEEIDFIIPQQKLMDNTMKAQQRLMQAIQTYQVGDLLTAEKELKDLLSSFPKSDQIMAVLAAVLFSQKKYKESYRHYREAKSINPKNMEATIGIASAEHARGNVDNAIRLMNEALEKFPDRLEAHFNLGTFYITQKELIKAEACFLKSLELEPELAQADLHLVNIYMELKQYAKAERHLRNAINANSDPGLKVKLKEIQELQKGSLEKESVAERPTARKHETGEPIVRQQGSVTDAFGIEEGDLNGLLALATAFLERHQYKEARGYFQKVLDIDDKNLVATTAIRKIKSASVPLWHFEMLADHNRNDAYQQAIETALKRKPGARVLDIGTGSGLLAMMAARAGASEVLACEMNSELAQVATRIVEHNGYTSQVKVLNLKSTDLRPGLDYEGKYDLVVSEILDVAGVGEGVLPSLRHAFDKLVKPGGITVPAGITMYAQLMAVPAFYRVNPVKNISGFDLSTFNEFRSPDEYLPIRLNTLEHVALSAPIAFHSFDFSKIPEARPIDNPHVLEVDFTIQKRGNVQAVVYWFDLHFDEHLTLSSGPGGKLKHWGQAICFMKDQIAVEPGTSLAMQAKYSDVTMWFEPKTKP